MATKKSTARTESLVKSIQKRDGSIVPFDTEKIAGAIHKAMVASNEGSQKEAELVANKVLADAVRITKKYKNFIPTVEGIQDTVEKELILSEYVATAKAYILYRATRTKARQQSEIVPQEIKDKIAESSKYFVSPYQEFIFYQFYSRWREELGRRETWAEAIDRFMDYMKENMGNKLTAAEYAETREAILKQEVCPSMRLLWSSGKACRRTNVTAYNCAYIAPTSWRDLSEIMYVSMCGAGCGFSVEPENVGKFPQIQKQTGKMAPKIVVEDDKVGWCEAFVKACEVWEKGMDVEIDYSKIRPAGAKLSTMGGRASGPDPLREALQFARRKMLAKQGRRLSTLDLHDIICQIGLVVVAGGVRRSALISLSAFDDTEMRDAKKGAFWQTNGQRSMANNSAVYESKPSAEEFLEEWTALVTSHAGERGIFNRAGLEAQVPARRWAQLKDAKQVGMNPCVTSDTWVTTAEGARQVKDLIGKSFKAVINGETHDSLGFFETGYKKVFEIKTDRGFAFKSTDNHKVLTTDDWKEVKDLKPGDTVKLHHHSHFSWSGKGTETEGWLLGSLLGDGNIEKDGDANLDYWGDNREVMRSYAVSAIHTAVGARDDLGSHGSSAVAYARVQSRKLGELASSRGMTNAFKKVTDNIEQSSSTFYEGFLRGWFDADGSVQGDQKKGVSVRLTSASLPCLHRAQRMLARLGIMSSVYESRRDAQVRMLPDGHGGKKGYECQAYHELVISKSNLSIFADRINFIESAKRSKLSELLKNYHRPAYKESFTATVTSITPVGNETVYDCTVPGPHAFDGNGFVLHNCGEIYLQSKQFCNLTSIVVRPHDTMETLTKKIRIATLIGTYQATLTNFEYLSKEWKENCEKEQLLGVSLTGYYDNKIVRNDANLRALRDESVKANKKYAKRFGVNESTAITCVKPHGNSGQLLGVGSGMHTWYSHYYIRRVRISANDPLLKLAQDQGVPVKPEVGYSTSNASTMVMEFPCKAPEGAIVNKDVTALELLEEWKRLKNNFTEHNPSSTIYVGDDEWIAVADFVYKNWDIVGGLSFLPRNDHVYQLAPYEEIDKAEYERRVKLLKHIDFSKLMLYEKTDQTIGAKELACVGGVCEIA